LGRGGDVGEKTRPYLHDSKGGGGHVRVLRGRGLRGSLGGKFKGEEFGHSVKGTKSLASKGGVGSCGGGSREAKRSGKKREEEKTGKKT